MNYGAFANIGWTVGNHCNATCGHCYSWKVRRTSRELLTEADIDRVVQQLVDLGVETVNLGGNEPIYTHGPDIARTLLPRIIERLAEARLSVGLTTNGVTFHWLDRHRPDVLALLNDIDFSLDSPYEAEHDENRGGRLFRVVIAAIERSVELGIDCSIIACGMRRNFDRPYLEAFLALAADLGSELRINTLKPIEPGLIDAMPTPAQFYEGFAYLMARTDCVTLGESCLTAFTGSGGQGCPCGTSSFRINAKTQDGRIPINPCVYAHDYATGDLLTEGLADIVTRPPFTDFARRRRELPRACRESGCAFLETCRGGCGSRALLAGGGLDAPDPYCPSAYLASAGKRPALPEQPAIGCQDGIRVHDNYLCTWIGKPNDRFERPQELALAGAREGLRAAGPLASYAQTADPGPSLIPLPSTPGGPVS